MLASSLPATFSTTHLYTPPSANVTLLKVKLEVLETVLSFFNHLKFNLGFPSAEQVTVLDELR